MRYIFLAFLWLCSSSLFSQTGNYFLSHYSPDDHFSNVCFDAAQDNRGMVYFATRSGVLEFDGRNWNPISSVGAVYSVQLAASGDLYWAGASGYGRIDIKNSGKARTEVLSAKETTDVFQSLAVRENIFFVTDHALYVENTQQKSITIAATPLTGSFLSIFELFESVYVNTERGGIFKVDGTKLVRSSLSFPDAEVIFCTGYNNVYLIGLSNNKVFLCGENLRPKEIKLQDQSYADASVVVNARWVNRDLFVLGTLRGGLLFANPVTGKTQEIVNYSTGLPDNEVYALMSDKNQCIWAAHEYGFTRIAPYLPFRSFSHYNGLSGNLLCALSTHGSVYVGTSLGLYKLQKEELYDEISYFVDVEVKEKPAKTVPSKSVKPVETVKAEEPKVVAPVQESKKKGFLSFLKRKRSNTTEALTEKPKEIPSTAAAPPAEAATAQAKPRYQSIKKTEKVLRTSQYVYKKVQGIDAKVTQLLELNGKLIAVGLGGAFEVQGLTSRPIVEQPVRTAYASNNLQALLLSTYSDEMIVFTPQKDKWASLPLLENLDDRISAMADGVDNELWLCGLDKAYRLTVTPDKVENIETLVIDNPKFDELGCIRWRNEILVAHTQGFKYFNRTKNAFESMDSLPKPSLFFVAGENILYNDSHNWNLLGEAGGQSNLRLLNLLKSPRFVSIDQDTDNLWVITENNELYKFFGEKFTPYDAGYSPLLKAVQQGDDFKNPFRLEIEEDKSSLTFNVIQPDYLAPLAVEYRYYLKGLEKEWSDWSSANNRVDVPYLPSGDYSLMVESRDIFGKIRDLPAVTFEVLPPYWQRPWFYAVEFFVFAGFVLLSFRLSNRYRIISRLLSLLTIIMLIQFIQTVVSEIFETKASPVTDFFLQVVVAFMILPVEGYLRNLMLRSLDSKTGLHKFLVREGKDASAESNQES